MFRVLAAGALPEGVDQTNETMWSRGSRERTRAVLRHMWRRFLDIAASGPPLSTNSIRRLL